MLSNRPLMSNSRTQSYFQHRSRVTPTASSADFLGLIAIGVCQKDWVQVRLNELFDHHLSHAISTVGKTRSDCTARQTIFGIGDGQPSLSSSTRTNI